MSPFDVSEPRAVDGHCDSHLADDLELAVPLYSLTLRQGLWVPLLVLAKFPAHPPCCSTGCPLCMFGATLCVGGMLFPPLAFTVYVNVYFRLTHVFSVDTLLIYYAIRCISIHASS